MLQEYMEIVIKLMNLFNSLMLLSLKFFQIHVDRRIRNNVVYQASILQIENQEGYQLVKLKSVEHQNN